MDCRTPGFPVLHHLPEIAQTHVHWVSDAISSSVVPFSSCLQSFPASGSFLMIQFFTSSGQSIGASASAISPSNEYSGLISFKIDCNTSCYNHIWGVCMVNTCRNWSKTKARRKIKETAVEMPGIEPGASYMHSMRSTTELHPPPSLAKILKFSAIVFSGFFFSNKILYIKWFKCIFI